MISIIYGYARVSTPRQEHSGNSLDAQCKQLRHAGAQDIRQDVFTGTKSERPALVKLLEELQQGDTLLVTKLDRLGRSILQVNQIISNLIDQNITVHVLNIGIMDNTPTGRLIRNIFLAIAEFERDMIIERTAEGKAIARLNPNYREGRRPKFMQSQLDHAMELLETHTYKEVAAMTGISTATLGRESRRRRIESS